MQNNTEKIINFSEKYLQAKWLTNVDKYYIKNRTIVVNIGNKKAYISPLPAKYLSPRNSTILKGVSIIDGDSLLLIEIIDKNNIGGIILDSAWHLLGDIADFPKDVPLWKSPQYEVGTVAFDPYFVIGISDQPEDRNIRQYQIKVNLWFSPAKTNCAIHHHHVVPEFVEVHTQIYGTGRMQKFHNNNFDSLYEDILMSPGATHLPFAGLGEDNQFVYPWHQYYSDTDCIWMASEFHPITSL